jgi:phosphoenolpyruvate synthase/pyruvate phosphate dikinase
MMKPWIGKVAGTRRLPAREDLAVPSGFATARTAVRAVLKKTGEMEKKRL